MQTTGTCLIKQNNDKLVKLSIDVKSYLFRELVTKYISINYSIQSFDAIYMQYTIFQLSFRSQASGSISF